MRTWSATLTTSEPRLKPVASMIAYETKANDEEIHSATAYFSGRKPKRWIRVVRQLYDMQSGARAGAKSQLMKEPVRNLSVNDMVSIAAYAAMLKP